MTKKATITDDVLSKIKKGEVQMKPAVYFSVLTASIVISGVVAGLAISYLSSIIFYWLKVINSQSMAYGARRNLTEALATFPWWTLIIIIALLAIVLFIVKKYGVLYRHKLRNIIILFLLASLMIGYLLSSVGIGTANHNSPGQDSSKQRGPGWRND